VGFSPFGLVLSLAVLAPNLLMIWLPPRTAAPSVAVPRPLAWLERTGQALCLVLPVIVEPAATRWWWSWPVAIALAVYYALWARYLHEGRALTALYRPLWKIPVPMAVMPVAALLAGSVLLDNVWLAAGALVLAAGHVPASVVIARSLGATPAAATHREQ
jgi:hypothetical protein